jgi:hypothetical protein
MFVSMRYTRSTILVLRRQWVISGLLRPMLCVLPSLLLYPFWRPLTMVPAPPLLLALWLVSTLAIAWWFALTGDDRREVNSVLRRLV